MLISPQNILWEGLYVNKMAFAAAIWTIVASIFLSTAAPSPSPHIWISSTASPEAVGTKNITQTTVYSAGEGGYYCFRIPALLFTASGTLLAFAEGRRGSCADHGDVHIVLKRSSDSGRTWSNLTVVHREDGHTIGEASLFSEPFSL